MSKIRVAAIALLAALAFVPLAAADVTVKMTIATAGGPMSLTMTSTVYVKALKMRSDISAMGQEMSMLIDVAAKQQLMLNHGTKQVLDPKAALGTLPMTFGDATVSVKPNGQTKEILGRSCNGFQVQASIPMTMNGETVTMSMAGVAWIAKDGPGVAEYQAFYKAAAAAGLSANPMGQGMQSKGMDEMYKAFADAGLPMLQEMQTSFQGAGEIGQAMNAMAMTITLGVTGVSAETIPDEKFVVPAGYAKQ